MENILISTTLTFSIGALFQTLLSVNNHQQQVVVINANHPQSPEQKEDHFFAILMLIGGLAGLYYMFKMA